MTAPEQLSTADLMREVEARRIRRRRLDAWHGEQKAVREARLASLRAELERPRPWSAGGEL